MCRFWFWRCSANVLLSLYRSITLFTLYKTVVFYGPKEVTPVDVFALQAMRLTLRFWRCTNRCCAAVRKHGLYGTARTQAGATEVDFGDKHFETVPCELSVTFGCQPTKKRIDWFVTLYAHGTSRLSRLITWSMLSVVNATMLHRMAWHWPHDQHVEYVVRIDVHNEHNMRVMGGPSLL